jgi:hypothetical protein
MCHKLNATSDVKYDDSIDKKKKVKNIIPKRMYIKPFKRIFRVLPKFSRFNQRYKIPTKEIDIEHAIRIKFNIIFYS